MSVELGHFFLILVALIALAQGSVSFVRAIPVDQRDRFARHAALLQWGILTLSLAILMTAFIRSDFSVALVAQNSHVDKPLIYKIAGLWGNHEGSMMLWAWVLASYGAGFAIMSRHIPASFRLSILGVMGLLALMFLSFIILTSNPFLRLNPAPFEGAGLNPVLQDPALAAHPPLLYFGYVGYALVFAFAMAALLNTQRDIGGEKWVIWARPWALLAWMFLTLGIALGSYWAYYELGWGGFWFWDPVENASLMPWLVGTAFLHSIMVTGRRGQFLRWTLVLAIASFAMSLIGTFLVRSGVLTSVHAFANDPARGFYILGMFAVTVGGAFTLYARAAIPEKEAITFDIISRESALLTNNIFLATATATVLIGTLYPLVIDMLGLGKISVGAPYFSAVFIPLTIPFFALMPMGPWLRWQKTAGADLYSPMRRGLLIVAALTGAIGLALDYFDPLVLAACGGTLWLIIGSALNLVERAPSGAWRLPAPRRLAGLIAHAGMGVMVLGVIGATAWKQELVVAAAPGDELKIAKRLYVFDQIGTRTGPNYNSIIAVLRPIGGGEILYPEKRFYQTERAQTTEAAIDVSLFDHVYAVLGEELEGGKYVIRIWQHPLVVLIWLGGVMMALAAGVGLWPVRRAQG